MFVHKMKIEAPTLVEAEAATVGAAEHGLVGNAQVVGIGLTSGMVQRHFYYRAHKVSLPGKNPQADCRKSALSAPLRMTVVTVMTVTSRIRLAN